MTREEWQKGFVDFLESRHCSLFGRHMSVSQPQQREQVAAWYADLVMRVSTGEFGI